MRNIELDYSGALPFVKTEKLDWQRMAGERVLKTLREGTCEGSDFLGWMDLPAETGDDDTPSLRPVPRHSSMRLSQYASPLLILSIKLVAKLSFFSFP